jgi:serine/threonine protein kinase
MIGMSDLQRCSGCGTAYSEASLVSGLCPRCLMRLGLGRVSEEHRILTVLGAGPSGTLFLAERGEALRKLVTVRHLADELAAKVEPARFESMLERLIGLIHANLVPVLDGGIVEGGPVYVVSEYVAGSSLRVFCERQGRALGLRIGLLASVCRATEHAHRHGITHGHLSAADVLVSSRSSVPTPLVRDFGFRMLAGLDPNPMADVVALGALLRDLIAPCAALSGVPAEVVRKAATSVSGDGYASAGQLADDLERCAGEADALL